MLTWVIQGDGLRLSASEQSGYRAKDGDWMTASAKVTEIRNLGETSLAVAAVSGLEGAILKITRSGPQRRHLEVGQAIEVLLDCDWVHVMPTKAA